MPSEVDPLLPRNPPAPEIVGYGFSAAQSGGSQEVEYGDTEGLKSDATGGDDGSNYAYGDHSIKEEGVRRNGDHDGATTTLPEGVWYAAKENGRGYNDEDGRESDNAARSAAMSQIIAIFAFVVALSIVITAVMPGGLRGGKEGQWDPSPIPVPDHGSLSIPERAVRILTHTPLFDGHNDLAIFIREKYQNKIHTSEFKSKFENGGMEEHVDIPRLKKGHVGGAFWSSFVPCPVNASYDFSDSVYSGAVSSTLSQIDLLRSLQAQYPSTFTPATTSLGSALTAFHANQSILGPLSIEGLHQIPPSAPLSTLRLYYSLGVRAATLTWNCHNVAADAALISDFDPVTGEFTTVVAPQTSRNGLSPVGRRVIKEMNRLGMLVDLSHTSYWTQIAVLSNNTSRSPVIYSHSSAFSVCPHPRNVHDDALELVRKTESLVMINFSPGFVSCLPPDDPMQLPPFYEANNTIEHVVDHIMYIGENVGYDHVGLGSDYDGMGEPPEGLHDVSKFPRLVEILLERNVSDHDVSKIVGGNLIRVWKQAEEVKRKMQEEGVEEEEDDIPKWGPP